MKLLPMNENDISHNPRFIYYIEVSGARFICQI